MFLTGNSGASESPMASCALVLCNDPATDEEANLLRIIDFFGISRMMAPAGHGDIKQQQEPYAIVTSAQRLAHAMQVNGGPADALPPWIKQASAVYVCDLQCNDQSRKLLEFLTGDSQATVAVLQNTRA